MDRFHFVDKCLQELPNFVKSKDYKSVMDSFDAPFHRAFKTDQRAFLWVQTQPLVLNNFLRHWPSMQSPNPWTASVPLDMYLRRADKGAPLFIDVGGGLGLQCVAFKQAAEHHGFEGRIIQQDLPQTLDQAPSHEGVEKMVQDFFQGQAVKGSRCSDSFASDVADTIQ